MAYCKMRKSQFILENSFPYRMLRRTGREIMKMTQQTYLSFSNWRMRLHSAQKPRTSVRFFRRSRNHSLIWNFVMQGYYAGAPHSIGECEEFAIWSRPTTRKFLNEAKTRGFLEIRPAPDDHRKRLVYPSKTTIAEYEGMVSGYIDFVKSLEK